MKGGISVDEFCKAFGTTLPAGDYETLSGWLNSQAGSIPEQGDRFFADGLQLTVVDRSPRRVRRVKVVRLKGKAPSPHALTDRAVAAAAGSVPPAGQRRP